MILAMSRTVKPFYEQKPFLDDDKRYYGYISGVGAGKTFAGIIRTIRNMTEWNPDEMGAIIAPTRQMIVNVILPEMRELGLFDPPINWDYQSAYSDEPGIYAPNGARALMLSADNKKAIERLRGLNLCWVWMDERTAIPKRAQDIAMQRLRVGNYRNLYVTTTPKGKDDTYDFFVGDIDATKQDYGKATLYEADDRRAVVGVPTSANPHTPEDYHEAMAADLPDEIRAQEVQGQFVEIGGGILTRDMLSFVKAEDAYSDEWTYHVGVDLGVEGDKLKAQANDTDYWCAAVLAIHRRKNEGYLIDLARDRGMTLHQGVQWLKRSISGLPRGVTITVESNQAQTFFLDACKEANLNVASVNHTTSKEDRIIQLSVPFENGTIQLVNHPKADMDKQTRHRYNSLGYDPRWEEFVNEWISWPEGNHDDALDAVEIAIDAADITGSYSTFGGDMYGSA